MRAHRLIVSLAVSGIAAANPNPQYGIATVDYPGFRGTTTVTGVNDSGRLVGAFAVPTTQLGFGFSQFKGTFNLLPNAPCQSAHCDTTPLAINSRGDIAGEFSDAAQHRSVFVIRRGTLQIIPVPSPAGLAIFGGLNERGDVVGFFQSSSGAIRMFEYSGITLTVPAVPKGFIDVTARGINNAGQITGSFDDAKGLHGFLEKHGRFTSFDVAGGTLTTPVAINERGDVVGNYSRPAVGSVPRQHGFLYARGKLTTLDVPGGFNTSPSALNDAGIVAGIFENPAMQPPFDTNAFVYQRGTFTRLPLPGAVESVAAISASGEVVGTYFDPGCPTICSVHGFTATPAAKNDSGNGNDDSNGNGNGDHGDSVHHGH